MNIENVRSCIKKLYTAELLQIIAGGLGILAAIFGFTAAASGVTAAMSGSDAGLIGAAASGLFVVLLGIAIFVIGIIVIILQLTGLHTASREDPMFNYAFIAAVVGLILSFLDGGVSIIPGMGIIANIIDFLVPVCNTAVIVCSVLGIRNAAQSEGRTEVVSLAQPIIIIQCIVLAINIIGSFVSFLSIIGSVLSLVGYIIYLVFLTRAKNNI